MGTRRRRGHLPDLKEGTGKEKRGYRKLDFCKKQAIRDGHSHFWVDTCCIDKSNSVKLNTVIISMFRWYERASKCYVYLTDFSAARTETEGEYDRDWRSQFRTCRWLTRGWTLQELLAPKVVEFYDETGYKLGDKVTMMQDIYEVTGIPAAALRGRALASFSIQDRFSWQQARRTKKPEDIAYSLLGICGVFMLPMYGEGQESAMARLRREIENTWKGPKAHDFAIPSSEVEMPSVENFVARETELGEIHAGLLGDGSRRTVVLHGLGGMGKTQLAVQYAKRHKDNYSAIFWISMRDETTARQSFARIAKRILLFHTSARHISTTDPAGELEQIVQAVLAWLGDVDNTRWLAIYDNYDNPQVPGNSDPARVDIRRFLPDTSQGSVIITTRSSQVRLGRSISVKKLTEARKCVDILSTMSRRPLSADDPQVLALEKKLDGLPLALATAGAYLDQVSVSIEEYLRLYESSWKQLHENDLGLDTYEDRTLYSTWDISLEHIRKQNEHSAMLLTLWCYFSNQDLWFELLCDGPTEKLPWLHALTRDRQTFTAAVRLLCNYGLVDAETDPRDNQESAGYSIHTCVHSWTIHSLNRIWNAELAEFAICAVGRHVPSQKSEDPWHTRRRLLQHAARCSQYLPIVRPANEDIAKALHEIGRLYADEGKMQEAEEMYMRALEGKEEALGVNHTSTLGTIDNLGNLYVHQGRMKEAEEMHTRALRGKEEAFGAKHTSTLETINNLGILYRQQKRFGEARMMYSRALDGYTEADGDHDTDIKFLRRNLHSLGQRKRH